MSKLVVYTSQTGFTKRYAQWLGDKTGAQLITYEEAKKKKDDFFDEYDTIVYGGWSMAGQVVNSKWFLEKAENWKSKKLAMFCVGASPKDNPEVDQALEKMTTEEQKKFIKVFYCQGGLNYSKMKLPSRLAMKAFTSMLKKKKDATESEKEMAKYLSDSYDISDEKYIEPILEYIGK